jgi:4'-phosphopantetheinyl transferase
VSEPSGIELWIVDLDQWAAVGLDARTLDADDQVEARRLRDVDARSRLLARRSATRWILADGLGVDPAAVTIERVCPTCGGHSHGRPSVSGSAVEFSVSSSRAVAAIAVSKEPVGVDIEVARADLEPLDFALSDSEGRDLRALAADQQGAAFLRLWTGKEAVLKAGGGSVADGLAAVDVSGLLTADRTVTTAHHAQWQVRHLSIDPVSGTTAVVALADRRGAEVVIRYPDGRVPQLRT